MISQNPRRKLETEGAPTPVVYRFFNEAFSAGMGCDCPDVENEHHSIQQEQDDTNKSED